jgi:hypothetical protein
MEIKEQKLGKHANKINNKMKPLQRIGCRDESNVVFTQKSSQLKTWKLIIWQHEQNKPHNIIQVFRNDKRKMCVVICDTDVAANQEVLGIAELSKKSLKIPKGQSESVYRRRKENTMAKRKSTKGQTTIYKTYIYNKRSSNTSPTINRGWTPVA